LKGNALLRKKKRDEKRKKEKRKRTGPELKGIIRRESPCQRVAFMRGAGCREANERPASE